MRTFADLRYEDCERPSDPECAYRLVVMACDISQGCLRRLPWEYGDYGLSQADQRVVDAVRASVSIPFFYKPTRLTGDDGRDCWLVDGAVLSRFPIAVFDVPPGLEPRWPTFGIKLGAAPGPVSEVHDTKTMSWAMLNTMTGFYDRMHIDDAAVAARTIVIDTGTVRATDLDLDGDTQDLLFRQGRQAAMKFLDGAPGRPAWDWEIYKRVHRNSSSPAANAAKPARDARPPAPASRLPPGAQACQDGHRLGHRRRRGALLSRPPGPVASNPSDHPGLAAMRISVSSAAHPGSPASPGTPGTGRPAARQNRTTRRVLPAGLQPAGHHCPGGAG
jgi:hypothetical protein